MSVIELRGVSKKYSRKNYYLFNKDFFWATRNLDLSVDRGEILGIVGSNGAGKSTLLRLIAKITTQTEGTVSVLGKVIPIMNVEGALNYALTARENILLLLSVFGTKKSYQKSVFHKIVAFAEISDHLDMLLSKLSSGMVSRLSFSVAINVPSDILLVDEVFAVGDQAYQNRCFEKLTQFKKENKTIIFISHELELIKSLCTRAIWMEGGRIIKDGLPKDIIEEYCRNK